MNVEAENKSKKREKSKSFEYLVQVSNLFFTDKKYNKNHSDGFLHWNSFHVQRRVFSVMKKAVLNVACMDKVSQNTMSFAVYAEKLYAPNVLSHTEIASCLFNPHINFVAVVQTKMLHPNEQMTPYQKTDDVHWIPRTDVFFEIQFQKSRKTKYLFINRVNVPNEKSESIYMCY